MKFLSMYKTTERNAPPTQQEMEVMGKLMEEWFASGKLLAAEGCMPTQFAARVRQTKGQFAVTDGPFTEAKEVVGGLAILQAPSREAAIEYVKEFMKVAGDGECELRQLYEMPADTSAKTANQ
jgi:hypothetical protein